MKKGVMLIGVNVGVLILLIGGIVFNFSSLMDFGANVLYRGFSRVDNEWTDKIYEDCKGEWSDYLMLECINVWVVGWFQYNNTRPNYWIYPLDEHFNGNCESSSLLYASILDKMGIKNKFLTSGKHIFNMVTLDQGYCIVDQGFMECVGIDKGEDE